jgi:hypothetical protein
MHGREVDAPGLWIARRGWRCVISLSQGQRCGCKGRSWLINTSGHGGFIVADRRGSAETGNRTSGKGQARAAKDHHQSQGGKVTAHSTVLIVVGPKGSSAFAFLSIGVTNLADLRGFIIVA